MIITLPGLVDPHVHVREPGATHKEDWQTATQSALAGGFTAILAMPNTQPPVTDKTTLQMALDSAANKAHCDYAQYIGAGPDNAAAAAALAPNAAGLKLYLDQTYGPLRLDDMTLWMEHFAAWPTDAPIVAHAESRSLAAAILMAKLYERPIHIAHVARKEEILLIAAAKDKGWPVTCEVTPHHLFLTDGAGLTGGRAEVRPSLVSAEDVQALWQHMDIIDCFATDHAPHTLTEKDRADNPPPGFPGLETALLLLLTAVHQGRLSIEDVIERCATAPRRIFQLPEQPGTCIQIDTEREWTLQASKFYTRCGWTPFEGWQVRGAVQSVTLRGEVVFQEGRVLNLPGTGQNLRRSAAK